MGKSLTDRDVAVLIPAAGSGNRFGNVSNKLHALLAGRPIWRWAIDSLLRRDDVAVIVMAASDVDRPQFENQIAADSLPVRLVRGGQTRDQSVAAMMAAIHDDASIRLVAIHDAARPLLCDADCDAVISAARVHRAAFLATPVTATLHRRVDGATVPIDRDNLFAAATPQVFARDVYQRALERHRGRIATDDVTIVARSGVRSEIVIGAGDNLKITYPQDLAIAAAILANRQPPR